jgi:hypothetical protein
VGFGYKVYFSERPKNRVVCWNPDTTQAEVVAGEPADGDPSQKLSEPYGLELNSADELLIADKMKHRICRLVKGRLEPLAVSDLDGHRKGVRGRAPNELWCPTSLLREKNGTLLCAYSEDHTIYRIHPDGKLELVLGIPPNRHYNFEGCQASFNPQQIQNAPIRMPTGLAKGKDGTLYFIERGYQVVREYHPKFGLRSLFPLGNTQKMRGCALPETVSAQEFYPSCPTGLLIDQKNRLFLADYALGAVYALDLASRKLQLVWQTPERATGGPAGITFGPDGVLWILDAAGKIVRGLVEQSQNKWAVVASLNRSTTELNCLHDGHGGGIVCCPSGLGVY